MRVQVAQAAHALVLASGTLAPVAALTAQLFPGVGADDIGHFSCGHVVKPHRLLALTLGAPHPSPPPHPPTPPPAPLQYKSGCDRLPARALLLLLLLRNLWLRLQSACHVVRVGYKGCISEIS